MELTDYERRLTRWVQENIDVVTIEKGWRKYDNLKTQDIEAITDVEPCVIYGGYCETCSYESSGMRFSYRLKDGTTGQFEREEYSFELGSFLREIMSYE